MCKTFLPALVILVLLSACGATASNPSGEKTIRLAEGVDLLFVRVPAGEFLMGSSDSDKRAVSYEKPQHKVTLDEYWIGKTEVTNAQYSAYAKANGLRWTMPAGKENHPVVIVSWDDAVAFCKWVTDVSGRQVRLPTEAEWEKAARGTDGRVFPWGNDQPTCSLGNFEGCADKSTAVGSRPAGASPYGALDMAGNALEWVADWYDTKYYANSPSSNPQGPTSGQYRVLRGGTWHQNRNFARAANRSRLDPSFRDDWYGFRVASASVP